MRNDGNVYTNITIFATNLWNSVINPTAYYSYKIDNVTLTGENASFRASLSSVSYTNVPNVDLETLCIAELNYTDASDSVEVDINVTTPTDEAPGARGSIITFTGSLGE